MTHLDRNTDIGRKKAKKNKPSKEKSSEGRGWYPY